MAGLLRTTLLCVLVTYATYSKRISERDRGRDARRWFTSFISQNNKNNSRMWANKKYLNEDDIPIALLIPKKRSTRKQQTNVKKEKKKSNVYNDDNEDDVDVDSACTSCFIGGTPKFFSMDSNKMDGNVGLTLSRCGICGEPLHLLVQIYAPIMEQNLHRTLYVCACDRCCDTIPGVTIRCLRSQQQQQQQQTRNNSKNLHSNTSATVPKEGTKVGVDNYDDNYWGYDDSTADNENPKTLSIDNDIESILLQLEQQQQNQQPQLKLSNKKNNYLQEHNRNETNKLFTKNPYPMYELEWIDEPPPPSTTSHHQSILQVEQMVQRYLEDEEDQDLVTTLQQLNIQQHTKITDSNNDLEIHDEDYDDDSCSQTSGTTTKTTTSTSATNEKDLWFSFVERIKRMPEQVLRYGYDGELLWPTITDPR